MPYKNPNDIRARRSSKYRILTEYENEGHVTIGTLTRRLSVKATQLKYWADLGLINESEESKKRRERISKGEKGRGTRYYDRSEVAKIIYMASLVNDGGLHPKVAAKFADILKTKEEPDSGIHWIQIKSIFIGVKHMGGLDEVHTRPSRRIGQAMAG